MVDLAPVFVICVKVSVAGAIATFDPVIADQLASAQSPDAADSFIKRVLAGVQLPVAELTI